MKYSIYMALAACLLAGCQPAETNQTTAAGTITDRLQKEQNAADSLPFERVALQFSEGTSLIQNRTFREKALADFLARIWNVYGKPDAVHFEGFSYSFRHKESGLVFTAYSAGSGPAYGGHAEDTEKLLPIIRSFDQMLDSSAYADCEITYDTDFGPYKAGCKNGVLFEEPVH